MGNLNVRKIRSDGMNIRYHSFGDTFKSQLQMNKILGQISALGW